MAEEQSRLTSREKREQDRQERQERILNKKVERELRTSRGLTERTKSETINAELNRWAASIISSKAAQVHAGNVSLQDNRSVEVEISDSGSSPTSVLFAPSNPPPTRGGDGGGGGGTELPNGTAFGDFLYWDGSSWQPISPIEFAVCENGEAKQYKIPAIEVEQ